MTGRIATAQGLQQSGSVAEATSGFPIASLGRRRQELERPVEHKTLDARCSASLARSVVPFARNRSGNLA
ncbi:hypothetical protein C3941_21445 [Kaistia algarum]|uniref:hypothetical protein n=1 Tax=Kaistia algarum TaxID=2083279 RepID=UPI000CE836F3|nr:hypothetical protein [Kaistia algarum]MCX5515361.1 hypothetical protein [Kaistia algarum]PPE77841.1 hypothetical protein C3941_21445 [Kaistia algarum]